MRTLIGRAKAEKLKTSIAGARHRLGGHAIAPDGIVPNILPLNGIAHVGGSLSVSCHGRHRVLRAFRVRFHPAIRLVWKGLAKKLP